MDRLYLNVQCSLIHRCGSMEIIGDAKDFSRISPKLLGLFLCEHSSNKQTFF